MVTKFISSLFFLYFYDIIIHSFTRARNLDIILNTFLFLSHWFIKSYSFYLMYVFPPHCHHQFQTTIIFSPDDNNGLTTDPACIQSCSPAPISHGSQSDFFLNEDINKFLLWIISVSGLPFYFFTKTYKPLSEQ